MEFFITASAEHQRREKQKARELRATQWWKNQLGRGLCHHCGVRFHPKELTMDHLIPIARGGGSTKGNVVPACKPCNSSKGYKTALDSAFEDLNKVSSRQNIQGADLADRVESAPMLVEPFDPTADTTETISNSKMR